MNVCILIKRGRAESIFVSPTIKCHVFQKPIFFKHSNALKNGPRTLFQRIVDILLSSNLKRIP